MADSVEYQSPCQSNLCTMGPYADEAMKRLCAGIAEAIIKAGGGDLLTNGDHVCPFDVQRTLGPEQTDGRLANIRAASGIVGVYEGPKIDWE